MIGWPHWSCYHLALLCFKLRVVETQSREGRETKRCHWPRSWVSWGQEVSVRPSHLLWFHPRSLVVRDWLLERMWPWLCLTLQGAKYLSCPWCGERVRSKGFLVTSRCECEWYCLQAIVKETWCYNALYYGSRFLPTKVKLAFNLSTLRNITTIICPLRVGYYLKLHIVIISYRAYDFLLNVHKLVSMHIKKRDMTCLFKKGVVNKKL